MLTKSFFNVQIFNLSSPESTNESNLFARNINFSLKIGDRLAVLGVNGCGKTTLLNCIYNNYSSSFNIAYVEQENDAQKNFQSLTILDYLSNITDSWWEIEEGLEKIFSFKISDYNKPINTFSGGQIMKIKLVSALILNPDILILDEPTNHLDEQSISQLLAELSKVKIVIFVSHNLSFIKTLGNKFLRLGVSNEANKFTYFNGVFEEMLEFESDLAASKLRQAEVLNKKIVNDKNVVNAQLERKKKGYEQKRKMFLDGSIDARTWGGLKAGSGKGASKIITNMNQNIANSNQLKNELSVKRNSKIKFNINGGVLEKNQTLFTIQNANLVLPDGEVLIEQIDLTLKNGYRIGLFGQNGSGKSYFVTNIVNRNDKLSLVPVAENSKIIFNDFTVSVIDQFYSLIDDTKSVLENINNEKVEEARNWLADFKFFTNQQVNQLASTLSGGQRARLAVAIACANGCDLLVLDEPSNNLDIDSQNELIECLTDYKGSIICISHDLEFVNQLGVDDFHYIEEKRLTKK